MNFIRNILFIVITIQICILVYVKFFYSSASSSPIQTQTKQDRLVKDTLAKKSVDNIVRESIEELLLRKQDLLSPLQSSYLKPLALFQKKHLTLLQFTQEYKRITLKKPSLVIQEKEKSLKEEIERYAKKFLGYKYVWGATGPSTFDCSGFTQKVYHSCAGIHIPRVSREQAKVGKMIPFEELERGDMVFFDTEKKFSKRVNHVGIYLKDGNFIHASSGGKRVMITNFKKKPFYKNRFLWGRRVLKSNFTNISDS